MSNGDFVIVWESSDQDGDAYGIYAQRFSSTGAKIGDEFQVHTQTADNQLEASITALNDGGFVISWLSNSNNDYNYSVTAQIFDDSGDQSR